MSTVGPSPFGAQDAPGAADVSPLLEYSEGDRTAASGKGSGLANAWLIVTIILLVVVFTMGDELYTWAQDNPGMAQIAAVLAVGVPGYLYWKCEVAPGSGAGESVAEEPKAVV